MDKELFKAVDGYIDSLFRQAPRGAGEAAQSIADAGLHDISVSANQGRFLQVMAKLCNASRILELGTFAGYSTIWLASALPRDGRLITIEYDETNAAIARKNFRQAGIEDIVEIRIGKALDILPQLVSEGVAPFDMIFIDADKPPYAEYFRWALKLARPGTLIITDNVIRHVFDADASAEKKAGVDLFNQLLGESEDVMATIIQQVGIKEHDGMAIAVVQ